MAKYNLTLQESRILISWLYEPDGYLDSTALVLTGQTAREALVLNPLLDLVSWIYTDVVTNVIVAHQCAMVWWIWKNDNVTLVQPIQSVEWRGILTSWLNSINEAFNRVGVAQRDNTNGVEQYDENSVLIGTIGSGTQLVFQQSLIQKVLNELV